MRSVLPLLSLTHPLSLSAWTTLKRCGRTCAPSPCGSTWRPLRRVRSPVLPPSPPPLTPSPAEAEEDAARKADGRPSIAEEQAAFLDRVKDFNKIITTVRGDAQDSSDAIADDLESRIAEAGGGGSHRSSPRRARSPSMSAGSGSGRPASQAS